MYNMKVGERDPYVKTDMLYLLLLDGRIMKIFV